MDNKMIMRVPDVCNVGSLICELFEQNNINKDLGTVGCLFIFLKVCHEKGKTSEEAKNYFDNNMETLWRLF